MGTNFYATEHCLNPCAHCQPPRLHIGKRSAGWTFGFEAHPHWVDADDDDLVLETRAQWREYLRRPGVIIEDEYGQEFTPDEFDALVDATREPWGPNGIQPRTRDALDHWGNRDSRHFRDPEGWDFWRGGFS